MRLRKKHTIPPNEDVPVELILSDEAIAVVDLYAEKTIFRAGASKISIHDPIYKNASWAFKRLEVPRGK